MIDHWRVRYYRWRGALAKKYWDWKADAFADKVGAFPYRPTNKILEGEAKQRETAWMRNLMKENPEAARKVMKEIDK